MRNDLRPEVAWSATTVPPERGFPCSNEAISLTLGPPKTTLPASIGTPQAKHVFQAGSFRDPHSEQ